MPTPIVPRETIAAIATAPGRGGIGVVRVSGRGLAALGTALAGKPLLPRVATLATFRGADAGVIDQGIALLFAAPHSYTGEDVLELQGHGGTAVMQRLLQACLAHGCRLAEPGEFTRRAYLNNKLDLAQAESVADLIAASSAEAAASAVRSLTGEFSQRVHTLTDALIDLRVHVEACIDFPEEEIDPADRAAQAAKLKALRGVWADLQGAAQQGMVLRDGLTVALIGRPNVGKSSLLNRLAGDEIAIVTPIAGTTRDTVRATISIDGVPIHLVDTAGLRVIGDTGDAVEKIGIERTWAAVAKSGAALLITEASEEIGAAEQAILDKLPPALPVAHVANKIDLHPVTLGDTAALGVSAKTGAGMEAVREWLLATAGWQPSGEGVFMARERHLRALAEAGEHLDRAALLSTQFDLYAEELRLAQNALARITGEFSSDDLLGEIFNSFCIGK